MARLFKRALRVTAYRPQVDTFFGAQKDRNAIVIENLRVVFDIEKHTGKHPNKCDFKIYNCNPQTRTFLETKPLVVRVEAGYDNVLQHLFVGDLRWGSSAREKVDWVTKISLGDGDRAYRVARINRSYAAGTPLLTVLKDAAASMFLTLPQNVLNDASLRSATTGTGVSISGAARDELDRLLAPFGLQWSIQDGRLQILRDDDVRADQAVLISQDTGMIGAPEFGSPHKNGKPPYLKVKHLIYPQLTAGGRIKVVSAGVKGLFRIEKLKHQGDTHGDEWTTEIEGRPLGS